MESRLVVTILWFGLMQTYCIGYSYSHVTYTNVLDHSVCIKYKVSHIHSIIKIKYAQLYPYTIDPLSCISNIYLCMCLHTLQDSSNNLER